MNPTIPGKVTRMVAMRTDEYGEAYVLQSQFTDKHGITGHLWVVITRPDSDGNVAMNQFEDHRTTDQCSDMKVFPLGHWVCQVDEARNKWNALLGKGFFRRV